MVNLSLPTQKPSFLGNGCGFLFGAVWIIGWSAGTLGFDGMLAYYGWRQIAAIGYPTVPAQITHSAVAASDDSTRLDLKYKFTVAGREFTCNRRRYNETSSNDGWAEKAIHQYPIGAKVAAHYNPRDPSDAVLVAGMDGEDLFLLMFLTPFNLIMLGSWAFAVNYFLGARTDTPAAGLKVIDRGTELVVRLPEFSSLAAAAIALLASTFVMVFVVGFSFGFHASLEVMLVVWSIILGITGIAYVKVVSPVWNGSRDLLINLVARRLTLPQTFGRDESIELPLEKVTGIAVEHHTLPSARLKSTTSPNAVTLYYRNDAGSTDAARLAEFVDKKRAETFADWLRTTLKTQNPNPAVAPTGFDRGPRL